jgi:glutathione synthase/RimK-type ligase-like ATP-grasp enzyme
VTRRARVAVATSARGRGLDQDLDTTVEALTRRDLDAEAVEWDDTSVHWSTFDFVVVKSTWGYPARRASYLSWAHSLERVENPADVLEWNTDKRYLADLAAAAVPTVPTTWIEAGSASPVELPEGELVVKPTVGAGGTGAARFGADERELTHKHIAALLEEGKSAMVQPYLAAIETFGERGLIFIDGRFSHAIYKPPLLSRRGALDQSLRTIDIIEPTEATGADLDFASSVLEAMPVGQGQLLYARVDIAPSEDGSPLLIELEVTEPNLYFIYGEGSLERFADAVVGRLSHR